MPAPEGAFAGVAENEREESVPVPAHVGASEGTALKLRKIVAGGGTTTSASTTSMPPAGDGDVPPLPDLGVLRSKQFLVNEMARCMHFFAPTRCCDCSSDLGGYYHFFAEDGTVYDKDTRVLVTQARFIFSYAVAHEHLESYSFKPDAADYSKYGSAVDSSPVHAPAGSATDRFNFMNAVQHGVKFLSEGPLRNKENGAYYWVVKLPSKDDKEAGSDDRVEVLEKKIFTYGLAQCLLAYAAALRIGVVDAKFYLEETWNLLEKHMWDGRHGLYAEEADENWKATDYRSESGNLHMVEALIAAYEATQDMKYLERALKVADNICNRQAGQTKGLVWEHFDENWKADLKFNNDSEALKIFRPWGIQPGHQVEWARFLLTLNYHVEKLDCFPPRKELWLVDKARYLFDVAVRNAWDSQYGGLAYSFDLDGSVCNDDKIFWVHCESAGTCAMLASLAEQENGNGKDMNRIESCSGGSGMRPEHYWDIYSRIWEHSWKYFVDHKYGSWRRRLRRDNVPHFLEKTKKALCVDPDFHMMGAFAGALLMMK
ncbi:unnamed protein product [Amoebophrya sp. A25]|nr:unnamed protein product [Amoebophrya sp. A25]|eukprot:GSA25T00019905001.1